MPTEYLREMLYHILTENSFQFCGSNYLQTHGAAMGTKMAVAANIRELKMETFSGRRRLDWQRKSGTEVAVASHQKSNIQIAVNSEGRRL